MGAKQKPSKWDGVIPETLENYVNLCKYQFLRTFPENVRIDVNIRMRDDITQEMETLAWEAKSKGMDVPQASRLFRNELRRFICKVAGWKHSTKWANSTRNRRNYWQQIEISNTLSMEWNEDNVNPHVYRRLGIVAEDS